MGPVGVARIEHEPRGHLPETYHCGNGRERQSQSRSRRLIHMRNIMAIVERELRTYFISPVAYVVLTIFVFLSGLFFRAILSNVMQMAMSQAMQGAQMGQGPQPIDM